MDDNPEQFYKYNNVTKRDAADSLAEYASKFKWKSNARVLDIGSADGSVTNILSTYMPKDYEMLIGCDINSNSVDFANTRYATDRMKFIVLDIEDPLSEHLKADFDHVFSFYTLHWLNDPEKGYMNIYELLKPGGECFVIISGKTPFYDIYHALSRTNKWGPRMKGFDTMVSPYHDCKDPDNVIYESFKKIGFRFIDVRCKQKVFVYESTDALKKNIASINVFKIPNHLQDEFLEDYIKVAREMRLVDDDGINMEDSPELFMKYNKITVTDAVDCLKEYASKFQWKANAKVFDIGTADGNVTNILSTYMPEDYELLMGCDINSNSVKFANLRYSTDRMKFIVLDIEEPIPEHLKEGFDHVFSFYTLHWLTDPVNGYKNIYDLLQPGGECFHLILARSPFYDIFQALSESDKWAQWMKSFDTFVSPYHDCKDPDNLIYESFKEIGFHSIEVRCRQKVFVYENTTALKNSVTTINLFNIPKDMQDEFLEDFIEVARDMRLVQSDDSVKFSYNIITVHCFK